MRWLFVAALVLGGLLGLYARRNDKSLKERSPILRSRVLSAAAVILALVGVAFVLLVILPSLE